jgi:hypothetical protein
MSDAMTRDDFVAALSAESMSEDQGAPLEAAPPEIEEPQAQEDLPSTEGEEANEAQAPGDGEAETAEAAEEATEDDAETAEAAPVDAPNWWDAAAKQVFAQLPPEAQAVVFAQEEKRETVLAKAKETASAETRAATAARQQADEQLVELRALQEQIKLVPQAETAFLARWAEYTPDIWRQGLSDPDPEIRAGFVANKALFDVELQELSSTLSGIQAAEARLASEAIDRHQQETIEQLTTLAPDLVASPESMESLGRYARNVGITPNVLQQATADELVILNKARLWDDAQKRVAAAAAKPAGSPTPQSKPAPAKVVAPTGRAEPLSQSQSRRAQVQAAFDRNPSTDTLAALLSA